MCWFLASVSQEVSKASVPTSGNLMLSKSKKKIKSNLDLGKENLAGGPRSSAMNIFMAPSPREKSG